MTVERLGSIRSIGPVPGNARYDAEGGSPSREVDTDGMRTLWLGPDDEREPEAGNARSVWAYRAYDFPAADQVRVLHFLTENGPSCLLDAASAAVASSDGIATVLALCCQGVVAIDLKRPLGPETSVWRPASR